MKKNILLVLFLTIFLSLGCQRQEVIKTHGISYLKNREKLVTINISNKNDVVEVLGHPSTTGMIDDNTWIYIERTKTRGKLLKFGKNYLKKNNVLVLEFDKYGMLANKEFYDKDHMKKVKFAKVITENDLKKENFVYSFLSSIRQKMQSRRK
jgi:outer membrane protein assembly factor BamE (lipoprotein component of BamABCDE complex)